MSFSSNVRLFFRQTLRRDAARRARRRQAEREFRRRRVFEALESRQYLDGIGLGAIPDAIAINAGGSYHYALEGTDFQIVDEGSVDGLTPSLPTGTQVAFVVEKTATDGAVSTLGEVVIQLFEAEGEAPNSSARFQYLVESGYYEGLSIHRIMKGFMFQGGSSDGAGYVGEGTTIADEFSDVLQHSGRGMVAFANKGPNTSDAQFYATFAPADSLDGSYNVFGFVVDGYDVVDALEEAEVKPNAKGELSQPIDSFRLTNVRVLGANEVDGGVLRLVATPDASGSTTISVSGTAEDGTTQIKEIEVKVVDPKGLAAQIPTSIELTAGETKRVEFPTEYEGSAVSYNVYSKTELEGISFEFLNEARSSFNVKTVETGAQYVELTVVATTADGTTATATTSVYVSPTAPTFALSDDVPSATLADGSILVAANGVDAPLILAVSSYSPEATISVSIDGTPTPCDVVSTKIDEETGLATRTVRLKLASGAALADGSHTVSVSQFLPIDNIVDHEALYGEATTAILVVDATAPEFVAFPSSLVVFANEEASTRLQTNKKDADGAPRSDVKFALGDGAPKFVSVSEKGELRWNPTAADVGDRSFQVVATDALGRSTAATVAMSVVAGPLYEIDGERTVVEGETFEITIAATLSEEFQGPFEFSFAEKPELAEELATYELTTAEGGASALFQWTTNEELGPGKYDFVVKIADPSGAASYAKLELTVEEENVAPKILYDGETTIETNDETPISIQLKATDADRPAQTLLWSLGEGAPEWASIDADGLLRAEKPVAGEYALSVFVSDGIAKSDALTLTFKIAEVDRAPVFEELATKSAKTGETFETTVVAVDPNTAKNPVKYELVGDSYPKEFQFDAKTGKISWTIPSDRLPVAVSAETFSFVVKATEQILGEDGETYSNGLATEKTFQIEIVNSVYDESKADAPEIFEVGPQKATAGETFKTTVLAGVPKDAYAPYFELVGDVPQGATIDAKSGEIVWAIPSDYFDDDSIESKTITTSVRVRTLVTETTFGGEGTTSFELTIANPNYQEPKPEYSSWGDWFDAWIANARARIEGQTANLTDYLNAYLNATDRRNDDLAAARAQYAAGKLSATDFAKKSVEIQTTFVETTTTARADLAKEDARAEADYQAGVAELGAAYETLAKDENVGAPGAIRSDALAAEASLRQDRSVPRSNFYLVNSSTGAKIATDLASALTLWRSGYSPRSAVYDDVFADLDFDPEIDSDVDPEEGAPETEPSGDSSSDEE